MKRSNKSEQEYNQRQKAEKPGEKKKNHPIATPTSDKRDSNALKPDKKKSVNSLGPEEFPIVGIGASAGGMEALEQFFSNMPDGNGMAFVVIQHLDPNHVGIMPELLQRITPMKVMQASDKLKVKPNCVYAIPPNKSLTILNGELLLFDPVALHGLRLPVDIFFRSLADDRKDKSIGIILSGMGSDGSRGVKAIKEKNGIVMVQDPPTAKFDGMPRNAIEVVIADIVAPADKLPEKLIKFLKFSQEATAEPEFELDIKNKGNLEKIIFLLRDKSGHDFSLYKKNTLLRRIERRKNIHQFDKLSAYVRYCQENPDEIDILFKELLIGVTSFFRDTAVWENLKDVALPAMLEDLPDGTVLRAWTPGCSTGEEAYSLAIVFKEVFEKTKNFKNLSLQIFATDLDQDAIESARLGFFSENSATDLSPERLSRFFTKETRGYRVNVPIREMVVFALQNLIKDPPFTRLDIIMCRNLLIYLEPELQNKIITLFNYSLNPEGILVLGIAETLRNSNMGFSEIDAKLKVFKRIFTPPRPTLVDFPSTFSLPSAKSKSDKGPISANENIRAFADQALICHFIPASVLIDEKGDILYMTGRIDKYLAPTAGEPNWNINVLARENLRGELPGAIRMAMQNFEAVLVRNIKVGTNGGTMFVDITVKQIESPFEGKKRLMVAFTDALPADGDAGGLKHGEQTSGYKAMELEIDLKRCHGELLRTREEMQESQEELKSINEEMQSTNEELQSTNEELTTSKEELQSMNEEMITVNNELQSRVNDFVQANNDMKNLLNSTEVTTIFLDKDLKIRRFTENVVQVVKIREGDIGRLFTDLATEFHYPNIVGDFKQVLKTLKTVENEMETNNGQWFKIRIMAYRTSEDYIDGLVMTFTDITFAKKLEFELKKTIEQLKQTQKVLSVSEIRFRQLFESAQDGILILEAKTKKIVDINPWMTELLGYSKAKLIGKTIWDIGKHQDFEADKEKFSELLKKKQIRYNNWQLETSEGGIIMVDFYSAAYSEGKHRLIRCIIRKTDEPNE
jgi:two-component system CheB/CheR fusion protein